MTPARSMQSANDGTIPCPLHSGLADDIREIKEEVKSQRLEQQALTVSLTRLETMVAGASSTFSRYVWPLVVPTITAAIAAYLTSR